MSLVNGGESIMKNKKRSSKNLKISTRIALSSTFGIIVPLIIVLVFGSVFLTTMASYFNFSTVTTKSYSVLNQIQWSQTLSSISNELISDADDSTKLEEIKKTAAPLEEIGTAVYIEKNGEPMYATTDKAQMLKQVKSIVDVDISTNQNYFGDNGVVIINRAASSDAEYLIIISDTDYSINVTTASSKAQGITSILRGKTGVAMLLIALIFVISIIVLSLITSQTILQPIKKISIGANEIANGNLDYVIDYDTTNELGIMVKSFNHMTQILKKSLEEKNQIERSRKEMIAGVAHDLRTPLTSVKGYVEGLKDGIANTPEKQKRYLDTIYTSTCDMEKLLDELLTVSRLELGAIDLMLEPININSFLDDCAEEISLYLEKLNFDFEYKNSCESDVIVDLDTDRFTRVIRNIVSNSVKYASPKRKGKIVLTAQSYQKSVIISLADNGIGLDSASIPRIFDTFFRADKARTNVRDGSGLGLSVCKQIIELHGGRIWATGKENQGLTILISLERRLNCNE